MNQVIKNKFEDRLIVALDVNTLEETQSIVDELYPVVKIFKIGSQLFTACGKKTVNIVTQKGARVFLDLKFHDIPNTVAKAALEATSMGVYMFNVHALGGKEMMRQAAEAAKCQAEAMKIERPIVLGVTILTSINNQIWQELGLATSIDDEVLRLARSAGDSGLDGVVASCGQIKPIRNELGGEFIIVSPGIRLPGEEAADHKKTATPKEAREAGADFVVVGRSITKAKNPLAIAKKIVEEIA